MAIAQLKKVIPVPSNPLETGDKKTWRKVQEQVGSPMPADLFDIAQAYGSGFFGGEIQVLNPFAKGYLKRIRSFSELIKTRFDAAEIKSHSIYPEKDGLYPCGKDFNGNVLVWIRKGNSIDWPILVIESETYEEQTFDMPLSTLLADAFSNKIRVNVWDSPFIHKERTFRSIPQ